MTEGEAKVAARVLTSAINDVIEARIQSRHSPSEQSFEQTLQATKAMRETLVGLFQGLRREDQA